MGEKAEAVADFIFLGSKITVDSDYSHELKDACSLKEKQRDITLSTKARIVKAMVFQQSCMDVRVKP